MIYWGHEKEVVARSIKKNKNSRVTKRTTQMRHREADMNKVCNFSRTPCYYQFLPVPIPTFPHRPTCELVSWVPLIGSKFKLSTKNDQVEWKGLSSTLGEIGTQGSSKINEDVGKYLITQIIEIYSSESSSIIRTQRMMVELWAIENYTTSISCNKNLWKLKWWFSVYLH